MRRSKIVTILLTLVFSLSIASVAFGVTATTAYSNKANSNTVTIANDFGTNGLVTLTAGTFAVGDTVSIINSAKAVLGSVKILDLTTTYKIVPTTALTRKSGSIGVYVTPADLTKYKVSSTVMIKYAAQISPKVDPTNISVVGNADKDDVLTMTGIDAGDTVNVYAATATDTDKKTIGKGTAKTGATSVEIKLGRNNITKETGIRVSITKKDCVESDKLSIKGISFYYTPAPVTKVVTNAYLIKSGLLVAGLAPTDVINVYSAMPSDGSLIKYPSTADTTALRSLLIGSKVVAAKASYAFINFNKDLADNAKVYITKKSKGKLVSVPLSKSQEADATGTVTVTAGAIAADILTIDSPLQDAKSFTLPAVPTGYTAAIKSSSKPGVIATNGTITPPATSTTVALVLTITNTSDNTTSDTDYIYVIVPPSSTASAITATTVAAGITTIAAPSKDVTSFTLPTVAAGYTVAIKSSSNTGVIATNGTIVPPSADTTVALVLTVTKTSDGSTSDTASINVIVPAKTVTNTITATTIAAGITTIAAPSKDATSFTLPTVAAGYTVAIKSSDKPGVITTDGTIVPPSTDTTVSLVLTVTKTSDGSTSDTASITVVVPAKTVTLSTNATLTSSIGTVDSTAETIVAIPSGTTLEDFKAAITPATGATFEVYQANGTSIATDLASTYKVIVTAQDGTTKKTYTLAVLAVGTVSGTVTAASGTITWATVNVKNGTTVVATGTTGANGTYSIANVPVGTYTIEFIKTGYTTATTDAQVVTDGGTLTANKLIVAIAVYNGPTAGSIPTSSQIFLNYLGGAYEYAITNIGGVAQQSPTYQSSNTFTGLLEDTTYKFESRVKAAGANPASDPSTESAGVSTKSSQPFIFTCFSDSTSQIGRWVTTNPAYGLSYSGSGLQVPHNNENIVSNLNVTISRPGMSVIEITLISNGIFIIKSDNVNVHNGDTITFNLNQFKKTDGTILTGTLVMTYSEVLNGWDSSVNP